ncbi:5-oxoprolinase subunit C family protein [Alkaliphilus transvaalensis]|uniref:5-oxoprolinase subunit C family protein n=1 Tax=Alkaliphilus transvaalensis TaxID=114628 RepID=UPI00047BE48A|nr:biotin-dependent carboxyltransferase family protein [Alkaliphilus transvaalensis]
MSSILVVNAGLLTTLQDGGRWGYQQFGIPVAGAMDRYGLELGNLLVGNSRHEVGLEFTYIGPTIKFLDKTSFAITGGDFQPQLNDKKVKMYQTLYANKGDILKFSNPIKGCRGYLTVAGGFDVEVVMGSKSTYLRGGFGGFKGRKLKEGDIIPIQQIPLNQKPTTKIIPVDMIPQYENSKTIRVILGPELDRFHKKGIETFLKETYKLSNQWDRMGYRLEGEKIQHLDGADIISGGINLGAIQVPGDGKPIIMMADHQTTGGYTKIANVISVDLPYLAQMKPGDEINFKSVSLEEAHQLLRKQETKIVDLQNRFNEKDRVISGSANASMRIFNITVKGKEYQVIVEERE